MAIQVIFLKINNLPFNTAIDKFLFELGLQKFIRHFFDVVAGFTTGIGVSVIDSEMLSGFGISNWCICLSGRLQRHILANRESNGEQHKSQKQVFNYVLPFFHNFKVLSSYV